jgi:hypothetical protein
MSSPSDLVTLANVKLWLNISNTTADDLALGVLISQLSRNIITGLNRTSVLPKAFTEVRDGTGKCSMMLRNYPVISMTSLTVDGVAIAASPLPTGGSIAPNGYVLEVTDPEPPGRSQSVHLIGSAFNRGRNNIVHAYNAGYQVSAEPWAAALAVTVQQPFGAWGSDVGVTNAATGAALTKVAGTPAAGQYQLSATVVGGYVFSAADVAANVNVLISYGFVPADLASACMDWTAERYKYRDRIGTISKTLGGQETVSFTVGKTPQFVLDALQPYMRVATF